MRYFQEFASGWPVIPGKNNLDQENYFAATMMQVQGANMMDMGTNPAAAFWGASRHTGWPNQAAVAAAGHHIPTSSSSDPKMAEKLMTELQVRIYQGTKRICYRKIIFSRIQRSSLSNI